jgi:bifunctional DNA-binding transcriptional regulator/antitoxin component of YhaV-PrlF toxin-antitoxin module
LVHIVGPKGQVVISKEIRDHLGVKPGWLALQRVVDDHMEVYFVPPEHRRSLKGSLADYIKVSVAPGEEWSQARENAWEEAAKERAGSRGKSS